MFGLEKRDQERGTSLLSSVATQVLLIIEVKKKIKN